MLEQLGVKCPNLDLKNKSLTWVQTNSSRAALAKPWLYSGLSSAWSSTPGLVLHPDFIWDPAAALLSFSSTAGTRGISEHTSDTLWEPMLNSHQFSLQIISPTFLSFANYKKRGAERAVHAVGTDETNLRVFLLPLLSSPGAQFLCAAPVPFLCCNWHKHSIQKSDFIFFSLSVQLYTPSSPSPFGLCCFYLKSAVLILWKINPSQSQRNTPSYSLLPKTQDQQPVTNSSDLSWTDRDVN